MQSVVAIRVGVRVRDPGRIRSLSRFCGCRRLGQHRRQEDAQSGQTPPTRVGLTSILGLAMMSNWIAPPVLPPVRDHVGVAASSFR